jgi:MinD-like ATPase involved in chromosome partitioning or flagellar assembly
VSARPWADAVHRFCEDHGGARVRARVIDEAAALAHDAGVLLLDDTASYLSGRLVERLHGRGTAVVVVVDADQFDEVSEWIGRLGVDAVVGDDEPVDRIVAAAVSVAGATAGQPTPPPAAEHRAGAVVAVVGVSGGVGATEVAIAVADAAPGHGVLADLDVSSPSVAQRLGLPLHPNLRSAVDASRAGNDLATQLIDARRFDVLGGPATSGDWAGIEATDVGVLIDALSADRLVVANLPAGPPRPHPHGATSVADLTRPLIATADVVVAVTLPTPVGVSRAIEWMAAIEGLHPGRLHLVLNRTPTSTFRRSEARRELERALEVPVWLLPEDDRVGRVAWAGYPVLRGPFRRAIRRLASSVAA